MRMNGPATNSQLSIIHDQSGRFPTIPVFHDSIVPVFGPSLLRRFELRQTKPISGRLRAKQTQFRHVRRAEQSQSVESQSGANCLFKMSLCQKHAALARLKTKPIQSQSAKRRPARWSVWISSGAGAEAAQVECFLQFEMGVCRKIRWEICSRTRCVRWWIDR